MMSKFRRGKLTCEFIYYLCVAESTHMGLYFSADITDLSSFTSIARSGRHQFYVG